MSAMPVSLSAEMMVAEQLLRELAPDSARIIGDDSMLSFVVKKAGWTLSRILLSRKSLQKLADDPQHDVKLACLAGDIRRTASRRRSYVFPYRLRLQ